MFLYIYQSCHFTWNPKKPGISELKKNWKKLGIFNNLTCSVVKFWFDKNSIIIKKIFCHNQKIYSLNNTLKVAFGIFSWFLYYLTKLRVASLPEKVEKPGVWQKRPLKTFNLGNFEQKTCKKTGNSNKFSMFSGKI